MKKILWHIALALIIFLPIQINAATVDLKLECPNKGNAGATVTCNLSAVTDGNIGGVKGNFIFDGLTYKNFILSNDINGAFSDVSEVGFGIITSASFPANFAIGSLEVNIPNDATPSNSYKVTITNIEVVDTNDIGEKLSNIEKVIGVNSADNALSSLSVTNGELKFDADTLEYNLTINAEKVVINAVPRDANAKVEGIGEKTLNEGVNTFKITVTSESGVAKTYTLNITRPNKTSDSGSSGTSGNTGSSTTKPSSDNSESKKSSDNKLSSLKVNNKEVKLSDDETSYKLTLDYSNEEVEIDYKTKNSKAKVKVEGDKKLKVGENTFKIIVTAEDGTVKTYTLTVTRASEGKKVSSNNYLKDLTIENYSLNFNKETQEYTVEIKSGNELNIKAIPEDANSSVKILGNTNLENGSMIRIVVTAEDGSTREYTVNVVKSFNPFLFIILGCLAILIVTIIVVVVKKRKK